METTTLAMLVLVPLLVWRIYSRLKRMLRRQRSHLWRHWAPVILFPLLTVALALSARSDLLALSCLGAGALAGAWTGLWGIRKTRFENTANDFFYTPNRYIAMAATMPFVARVLYRGLDLYVNSRAAVPLAMPMDNFMRSVLTVLAFGILAGYYATYGWALIRWRGKLKVAATGL